jgi:nucleoside-diphosphate-sugar epimerase
MFYGPGTGIAPDGVIVRMVRKRTMPLVGKAGGIWSFVHVRDAATATVAALTRGAPGIYNIADDEPAPVSEWLPYLARVLGAKPPRRIPAWLAKFAIGDGGVSIMTKIRGGSNAKARREFGWQPEFASWRTGFVETLSVSS